MDAKKKELLNKIYNYAITIFSIVLGILFISFTCAIYYGAKKNGSFQIYTPEIISKYWGYLLIPFILWVLLIIFGVVFYYLYPLNKNKYKVDEMETYFKLKNRIPVNDDNYSDQLIIINKERKNRKLVFIVISIISLLCMIFPAIYLFNYDNFSINKPEVIIKMAFNVFPWIIGVFLMYGAYLFYISISIKKELKLIREILKTYKGNGLSKVKKDYSVAINVTRISILVIGLTFLIIGIVNGGPMEVFDKAVQICMECIGIT